MEPRPTGTVTFAFTDIEGSTARWELDRVAMQEAVRLHDAIVRAAVVKRGGVVFKTVGDAFYSAFARPHDAVAAMLDAQQQLAAQDFAAVDGLRVRCAIHTGTADERDGDYFGPTLNRVARLLATGHGGQVLLSGAAAALVARDLPAETSLRDLGAYHLKDLADSERIYQLLAPGLAQEFPPLRSLGTLPGDLAIVDGENLHPVPGFSGRDEALAAIEAALAKEAGIAIVHGLGGVGKSSVAREYAWRNRARYSVIWWLHAQTEDGIIDGFLRLGAMFQTGLDQLADRRAAAARVVNSILSGFHKPILLVFDSLEDERLLHAWLPRGGAHALVTSREAMAAEGGTPIALSAWPLDTAVEYLRRESGRTDLQQADARAIAAAVGALPLALAHAAASLRRMRMVDPARYLERIADHLKNAPRNAEYPQSVFATFTAAMHQAEREAAGAAAVLCFAACFASNDIPDELFRQPGNNYPEMLRPNVSEGEALDLHSVVLDEMRLDEALGALDRLSLLAFSQSARTYSIHRLVQLAARDLASPDSQAWRESAVDVANAAFPTDDFAAWPLSERLLPHARAALDALPSDAASLPAADLASRCGVYVWRRGDYRTAEALHARALAIRETVLGTEHLDVATSLTQLAIARAERGRHDEACRLFERALSIREEALDPHHPAIGNSLSNLAHAYADLGRHDEAVGLYERALASHEKALGPDHTDVATSLDNLAGSYCDAGRFDEAESMHRRALAIRENVLGVEHPQVAYSLINLAEVYAGQGRYDDAEPLSARALAIREKTLGPDHPDVANALIALANVHEASGRGDDARALRERALAIREEALGPDHLKTKEARETLYGTASLEVPL